MLKLFRALGFGWRCYLLYNKDYWRMLTKRPKDVTGKVIVITGAAQGIGRELAKILAVEKGAKVALIDIDEDRCEQTAQELLAIGCSTVIVFRADVTDSNQMKEVAQRIYKHEQLGDVDMLICNAGVVHLDFVRSQQEKHIRQIMDVNFFGYLWTIRAFLGRMEELNRGHIVAICSVAGFFGESKGHAYCSSKHAIRGLMESLELELAEANKDGVRLSTVHPYFTDTALLDGKRPSAAAWHLMTVDECARGIVDGVLRERVEFFVPTKMFIVCHGKALVTNRVKLEARAFFRYSPDKDSDNDKDEQKNETKLC